MGGSDSEERPVIPVAERHTTSDLSMLETHDVAISDAEYGMLTQAMLMRGNMRIVLDAVVEGMHLADDALNDAISALQRRHVWLRCVLAESGKGKARTLVMREDKSLEVRVQDVTGGGEGKTVDDVVWGDRAAEPLQLGAPLWRVFVDRGAANTTHVYLLIEHGIADGVCSTAILGELLGVACGAADAVDCSQSEPIPIAPVAAMDADLKRTGCFGGCAQACENAGVMWKFITAKKGFVWPEKVCVGDSVGVAQMHCHVFTLTVAETDTLVELSRANKTTVTGAVCACLVLAAADTLAAEGTKFSSVSCGAAIDMRRRYVRTRVPRDHLACHISGWMCRPIAVPRGDMAPFDTVDAMWDVARRQRASLVDVLESRRYLPIGRMMEGMYRSLADGYKHKKKWKDVINVTTSSTSWGVCDVARSYAAHTVDRVRARVMLHGTRVPVCIFHTCAGRLSITVQVSSPACPPERGASVGRNLERRLRFLLA